MRVDTRNTTDQNATREKEKDRGRKKGANARGGGEDTLLRMYPKDDSSDPLQWRLLVLLGSGTLAC